MFPSPCGDYGSYHLESGPVDDFYTVFPSPCGDYGSYQYNRQDVVVERAIVSVPLRGLWFLSPPLDITAKAADAFVSVPLRGLWFLSFWFITHASL